SISQVDIPGLLTTLGRSTWPGEQNFSGPPSTGRGRQSATASCTHASGLGRGVVDLFVSCRPYTASSQSEGMNNDHTHGVVRGDVDWAAGWIMNSAVVVAFDHCPTKVSTLCALAPDGAQVSWAMI